MLLRLNTSAHEIFSKHSVILITKPKAGYFDNFGYQHLISTERIYAYELETKLSKAVCLGILDLFLRKKNLI